jgi:translation initiation factor 4G
VLQAAKEKAAQEKESYQRQMSMSRGGSRRGGDRGDYTQQVGPDGWAVAGNGPPRPPPKAGDLSKFGQISKSSPMTFGPSSVFAGKKEGKRESLSRTSSSSNMFSMLSQNPESTAEASSKGKFLLNSCETNIDSSQQEPRNLSPSGNALFWHLARGLQRKNRKQPHLRQSWRVQKTRRPWR